MPPRPRRRGRLVALDLAAPGCAPVEYWAGEPPHPSSRPATAAAAAAVGAVLRSALVPDGYPHSVTPDYAAYQAWDSVQGLCSYVRGVLANQAVLMGLGVGKEAATPLGAAFQFFLRDAAGMAAGVAFASAAGAGLDAHAKQWRLAADALNSLGLTLDLLSPRFGPTGFLALACAGSVARALCGVAAGATRAALTSHFAAAGNAADVAAKEGTQETVVTLVGMVAGMGLARVTAGAQSATLYASFALLTLLHAGANVAAVRALRLTSVNRPRAALLVAAAVAGRAPPTPAEVAALEPLAPPPLAALGGWVVRLLGLCSDPSLPITLGASLADVAAAGGFGSVADLVAADAAARPRGTPARPYLAASATGHRVCVALAPAATPADAARAYVHALLLAGGGGEGLQEAAAAGQWMDAQWPPFAAAAQAAGWDWGRPALGATQRRAVWGAWLPKEA